MITIEQETLKKLILRSEPDFLTQVELQINGYGSINEFSNEDVWVWSKERINSLDEVQLVDLTIEITK